MCAEGIKRADPDSPNRCQGTVTSQGQCPNEAVPGGEYCLVHGGSKIAEREAKRATHNYRVKQYQARLEEKSKSTTLKSLSDEIAVLRIITETVLNECINPSTLVAYSATLADLVLKTEKLVTACHKLDKDLESLVGADELNIFANKIVEIMADFIKEPDDLRSASVKVQGALECLVRS